MPRYEDWCEPKLAENALEILDKEIPKLREKINSVHLCFTTDPFMVGYPEVSQMSIEIIKKLNAAGVKCSTLTKGLSPIELSNLSRENEYGTILMVDSNIQRENLSLMEKARSYRMKLDAIRHQGTSRQNVEKSEVSAELISKTDSGRTVQRLIRLTYLVPELQEFVDKGKMKMLPAYELSFLDEEAQRDVVDRIDETETFPSHAQARRMRTAFNESKRVKAKSLRSKTS